jgi:transcriptional regulator with XRE-family HTH domain
MESENAIADRILAFMKAEEISSGALADRIGVQRSSISHILSGRNKPGFEFLRKFMAAFPEVNADWFITGRGNMLKAPVQKDLFSDDQEMYSVSSEENVRETGNNVPEATTGTEEVIPPVTTERAAEALKIPLKGRIVKVILLYEDGHFDSYTPGS